MTKLFTRCCVIGGGPCGLMLAFLLARAGVDVVVLEKHADFLRDFRGDTIHPSTLEIMGELGLLDTFLKLPHQELRTISAFFGQREFIFSDYTHLPTRCKFIALMPQWDFLNFISEQAKKYSSFQLHMQTEAVDLIEENGRVVGVVAETEEGALEIRADLTVGCDGRNSRTRARGTPLAQSWCADRRPVVSVAKTSWRSPAQYGPSRRRTSPRSARSRRLLAMCICDREELDRGDAPSRARGFSAGYR
jgi:2-polyprenyl-6-methoxyphenol hydroxylase-like FAD-dependent oxidoreductase